MSKLWIYYACGSGAWIIGIFISPGDLTSPRTWFPSLFVIGVLLLNLCFSLSEYIPRNYELEVQVYEYVERNTYYLIMAITIFLLVSTNQSLAILQGESANIIIGSQAVAVSLCVIVLALVWMPTQNSIGLIHLRHFKTVLYTFALGLFLIGPTTLLLDLMGN